MSDLMVQDINGSAVFTAKIVPGSSRTSLAGILNGMLKVKVAAPPEKGKANQNLVEFLADQLNIKKKDIKILTGQTSPIKQIQISGISSQMLISKLNIIK